MKSNGFGYARLRLGTSWDAALTFDSPVTAVGYDLKSSSADRSDVVQVAIDGVPTSSYNLPATSTTDFVGFVSDVPFSAYCLTACPDSWHGVDNVEAYQLVPEPASLVLGALGLASLALLGWRKQSRPI